MTIAQQIALNNGISRQPSRPEVMSTWLREFAAMPAEPTAMENDHAGSLYPAEVSPSGEEMTEEQWSEVYAHALTIFMSGRDIERDQRGEMINDDDFLWLVNGSPDDIKFVLPGERWGPEWEMAVDTATAIVSPTEPAVHLAGSTLDLPGRSMVVLRRPRPDPTST